LAVDLWQVDIDLREIETALLNLASNAREAMGERGRLTIETQNFRFDGRDPVDGFDLLPGNYVCLAISGIGALPLTDHRSDLTEIQAAIKRSGGTATICSGPQGATTVNLYLRAVEQQLGPDPLLT